MQTRVIGRGVSNSHTAFAAEAFGRAPEAEVQESPFVFCRLFLTAVRSRETHGWKSREESEIPAKCWEISGLGGRLNAGQQPETERPK